MAQLRLQEEALMQQAITLTPSAIQKAKDLKKLEAGANYLRVYVQGGGCSGLSYGLAFDKSIEEDDALMEFDGLEVIVDSQSMKYLSGSEIDYVETLMGAGFKFANPNERSSCACGHSFSA